MAPTRATVHHSWVKFTSQKADEFHDNGNYATVHLSSWILYQTVRLIGFIDVYRTLVLWTRCLSYPHLYDNPVESNRSFIKCWRVFKMADALCSKSAIKWSLKADVSTLYRAMVPSISASRHIRNSWLYTDISLLLDAKRPIIDITESTPIIVKTLIYMFCSSEKKRYFAVTL